MVMERVSKLTLGDKEKKAQNKSEKVTVLLPTPDSCKERLF